MKPSDYLKEILDTLRSQERDNRLWSIDDLQWYFDVAQAQAYKIANHPTFPKPIRALEKGQPRWKPEEVKGWAETRKSAA